MIEKFDFYDIYGYLLPGVALMMVLWLPFGLVADLWPSAELASAVLLVALAYIAGLLLHGLAAKAFSEEKLHPKGRYPSDFILDPDHDFFGKSETQDPFVYTKEKAALLAEISNLYGESLARRDAISTAETTARRNRAFLLCRTLLRSKQLASYAEHFQGLYSLMRGLVATSYGGAAYYTGWALGAFGPEWRSGVAAVLVVGVLLAIFWFGQSQTVSFALGVSGAVPAGIFLSARLQTPPEHALDLLIAAALLLAIARRSYAAYGYWTVKFAETVYRDFYAVRKGSL